MKVLITGGYGFIGSHIADRFYKESHQIYIIDNLIFGNTKNIEFKHKSYILETEDSKCEVVFKANKFDLVIYASSQQYLTKKNDENLENSRNDLQGLINILQLSKRYGISKFIFISSYSVYNNTKSIPLEEDDVTAPISMDGINRLACELYCKRWSDIYGLNTIILRISNAYGPRQEINDNDGMISDLINSFITGEDIVIEGDGEQTHDFIYISDISDAVYKSYESDIEGVYNLSTQKQASINEVIDILKVKMPDKNIIYNKHIINDLQQSSINNSKIKMALDWVPIVELEEGITNTLSWYESKPIYQVVKKKIKTGRVNSFKRFRPYIENLIIFLIIILGYNIFDEKSIVNVFPYLFIYILLIGISYGMKQSMVSVALSSIFYISTQLTIGIAPLSIIYNSQTLFQISLLILIGLVVGYSIDKKDNIITDKANELGIINEKYNFLAEIYSETRIVKEHLQSQITSSENSFAKVFDLTKQLDSLEPEVVYHSTIHVMESVMKTNKVAIYIVGSDAHYMRLMAKSNTDNFNIPVSIKIDENPILVDQIKNRSLYVNNKFDSNMPFLSTPIIYENRVIALISLYEVNFENITLHYKNLFTVVVNLVSASISKSLRFDELLFKKKHIKNTYILKNEYFANILKIKEDAKEKINVDFVLVKINYNHAWLEEISDILTSILRENDYIGMIDKTLYVLLSNIDAEQSKKIIAKLRRNGVEIADSTETRHE